MQQYHSYGTRQQETSRELISQSPYISTSIWLATAGKENALPIIPDDWKHSSAASVNRVVHACGGSTVIAHVSRCIQGWEKLWEELNCSGEKERQSWNHNLQYRYLGIVYRKLKKKPLRMMCQQLGSLIEMALNRHYRTDSLSPQV